MSDEKPVALHSRPLKRKNPLSGEFSPRVCIVHYAHFNDSHVRPLSTKAFNTIRACADVRLSQDLSSTHRLQHICSQVPVELDDNQHGAHRRCYKNFTNTSRIQIPVTSCTMPEVSKGKRMRLQINSATSTTSHLLPKSCLFCGAVRKCKKGKTEFLSKCVTHEAQKSIQSSAVERNDFTLLGKISDVDLIAKEAMYHESCRRNYTAKLDRAHHVPAAQSSEFLQHLSAKRDAHKESFDFLCRYIHDEVIGQGRVIRMKMAHEKYQLHIIENNPGCYNEDHQVHKLKEKLQRHFGRKLSFWSPNSKSELIYSSDVPMGAAVQVAFEASTSEMKQLEEAALILRRHVIAASKVTSEMQWPPSADTLLSEASPAPEVLKAFLSVAICGHTDVDSTSEKNKRLVDSIASDVCSAVTKSQWKMPKHLLLGMSIRHLTGSAQLITLLNRFGHCVSYTQILELETAMASQVQLLNDFLPSNISLCGNKVVNTVWDNFDLLEETPSGADTTHSTHGIVIQEVYPDCAIDDNRNMSIPKSRRRSVVPEQKELAACFAKKNTEPALAFSISASRYNELGSVKCNASRNLLWTLCRSLCKEPELVPSWSAWLSTTSDQVGVEQKKSVIGYMAPVLKPITDKSTVQHCLNESMNASKSLGQDFTFVTMDLAAAKIAYDIAWNSPSHFESVIIHLGGFHTACSFMGALGKFTTGSGFEEVIIEAGVCASGSITKVMSGKHYNRALRVHILMLETCERLLLNSFAHDSSFEQRFPQLNHSIHEFARDLSNSRLTELLEADEFVNFASTYNTYRDEIRQGSHGKTAQYWLMYVDSVWNLLNYIAAIKENDVEAFITSVRSLLPLLFAADHVHYARYLSYYYMQLVSLKQTHPAAIDLLRQNGLSASRSNVPANRVAFDMTIEQTINRSAKTNGGIIGFSRNKGAYYRWCITRHLKSSYWDVTRQLAAICESDNVTSQGSVRAAARKSEKDVQQLLSTVAQFQNPFANDDISSKQLICISSGQPATAKVEEDLLNYVDNGDKQACLFITQRLVEKEMKFHDPVRRNNYKTFESMAVKKVLKSSQLKSVELKADRNFLGRLLMLSQRSDLDLPKLFCFQLGPIPWAICTADGHMTKSNKAQLMHAIEKEAAPCDKPPVEECIYVVDGNAQLQSMTSLPDNFGQLAQQVFNCLPKASVVHFVTDTYQENSIKQAERDRRGTTAAYSIGGPLTKIPHDFKSFMLNAVNKLQLIRFLCSEWQSHRYASMLFNRTVYFVCEQKCVAITSHDSVHTSSNEEQALTSDQEEADTRIVLHCIFASKNVSSPMKIIVRSPDTDVFILLLAYANSITLQILFDTGCGNKRRLIDVKSICEAIGSRVCGALPGLHAFTGCDYTSSFVRRGKVKPLQLLRQSDDFVTLFEVIGNGAKLDLNLMPALQKFVCCMYGKPSCCDVNKVRYELFAARYDSKVEVGLSVTSGIDASLLPPCFSALVMHARRANYVTHIWKNAHVALADIPSPIGNGWQLDDDGKLSVLWNDKEVLPEKLIDILETTESSNEEVEEDVGIEIDNIVDVVFDDSD